MDPTTLSGSLVVAIMLNWGLFGVLVLQTYIFYIASPLFPGDRIIAKAMVYSVLLLEIAQTVISSLDVYSGLAGTFGSTTSLDLIYQHWLTVPIFGALTGGIGQFFFAYRIWGMTGPREKGTPIIIGVLGLASFASGIVAGVTFFEARTFSNLINNSDNLAAIGVWNGLGSLCDIVIALSMPYYLMRRGTGLRSTHIKIVNLITLIIETGIFTAAIAILHFCLYFIKTTAFIVPGLTISKVYGNTMLVILNNRIASGRSQTELDSLEAAPRRPGGRGSVFAMPSARHTRRVGESSIIVTKDRLIFRLDSDRPLPLPLQPVSDGDARSTKESARSSNLIYGHAFSSEGDLTDTNAVTDINNPKAF